MVLALFLVFRSSATSRDTPADNCSEMSRRRPKQLRDQHSNKNVAVSVPLSKNEVLLIQTQTQRGKAGIWRTLGNQWDSCEPTTGVRQKKRLNPSLLAGVWGKREESAMNGLTEFFFKKLVSKRRWVSSSGLCCAWFSDKVQAMEGENFEGLEQRIFITDTNTIIETWAVEEQTRDFRLDSFDKGMEHDWLRENEKP